MSFDFFLLCNSLVHWIIFQWKPYLWFSAKTLGLVFLQEDETLRSHLYLVEIMDLNFRSQNSQHLTRP